MAWKKSDVAAPIFNEIGSLAGSAASSVGAIASAANVANATVNKVKKAYASKADPLASAFKSVVGSARNLLNDTFGSGVFMLTINQFDVPGARRVDDFGIPLLYPREALQMAIESFDDNGDSARPQFSEDATVCAYGFLATAPTVAGVVALVEELIRVFDISEWQLIKTRYNNASQLPTLASNYPDWQSLKLNSISQIAGVQDQANKMLKSLEGNVLDTHDAVKDAIDTIQEKSQTANDIIDSLQQNLTNLSSLAKASGLYTLNVPPHVGGNEYLKEQIFDCDLTLEQTGYTVVAITVGGGPTLNAVDRIRKLTLGNP